MKVRHERPMADLSFSVRAPLGLALSDGTRVTIREWSLSGVHYPEELDVFPKEAVLSIPFQGVDIRFPVRLLRQDDSRFLHFDRLTGRQRETLAVLYRSLLSGRMAATETVITSLDTPVDLVPMGETADEEAAGSAQKAPRALRAALSVGLYLVLGALVAWTLGAGIYGKLSGLAFQNARIEAAIVPHLAPDTAYVAGILAAPGARVEKGAVLVRLTTPEGEAALAEVRGQIEALEARMTEAQTRETALAARVAAARAAHIAPLRNGLDETGEEIRAARAAFDAGLMPESAALVELSASAQREVESIDDALRRLRRDRGRLKDAADALHVIAERDGTVRAIDVTDGQYVRRGAPVAQLEALDARQARGWLDHAMAAALYPGMAVRVALQTPSGPREMTGAIASIEAGIDPALSPDFGMLVAVAFPDLTAEETRALPHLIPVTLRAERAWASRLADRLAGLRAAFGL